MYAAFSVMDKNVNKDYWIEIDEDGNILSIADVDDGEIDCSNVFGNIGNINGILNNSDYDVTFHFIAET